MSRRDLFLLALTVGAFSSCLGRSPRDIDNDARTDAGTHDARCASCSEGEGEGEGGGEGEGEGEGDGDGGCLHVASAQPAIVDAANALALAERTCRFNGFGAVVDSTPFDFREGEDLAAEILAGLDANACFADIVFDAGAANACAAAETAMAADCTQVVDTSACAHMIVGTKGVGDSCGSPSVCDAAPELTCYQAFVGDHADASECGVCGPIVGGEGTVCDIPGFNNCAQGLNCQPDDDPVTPEHEPDRCFAPVNLGDICLVRDGVDTSMFRTCPAHSTCVSDTSTTSRCVADLALGDACPQPTPPCEPPLSCNAGTCARSVDVGDACDAASVCAAGSFCTTAGVCAPLPTNGEDCTDAGACAGPAACHGGTCVGANVGDACVGVSDCGSDLQCAFHAGIGACVRFPATGAACSGNPPCAPGDACDGAICAHVVGLGEDCTDTATTTCAADSYCGAGFCVGGAAGLGESTVVFVCEPGLQVGGFGECSDDAITLPGTALGDPCSPTGWGCGDVLSTGLACDTTGHCVEPTVADDGEPCSTDNYALGTVWCRHGLSTEHCGLSPGASERTCVPNAEVGERCDLFTNPCMPDLECDAVGPGPDHGFEFRCLASVGLGDACGTTTPCGPFLTCVDSVCQPLPPSPPPTPAPACP